MPDTKWPVCHAAMPEWKPRSNAERVLRCCIARGMRYENGVIYRPSGRPASCRYIGHDGYRKIALWSLRHGRAIVSAHRVICWLVHGPPPHSDSVADHINHDRLDNRPCNLQWLSFADNTNKVAGGLSETRSRMARGESNHNSKMTEAEVVEMRERHRNGESYASLSRNYGVTPSVVRGTCLGVYWKHIALHARLTRETGK